MRRFLVLWATLCALGAVGCDGKILEVRASSCTDLDSIIGNTAGDSIVVRFYKTPCD